MNSMPEVRAAMKAVIMHEGKFLVMRHILQDGSTWWDVSGGKVDHGEAPLDTLHREVQEETGLEIEVIRPLGVWWFIRKSDQLQIVCTTFVCKPKNTEVDLTKNPGQENIQEYKWVTKEEFLTDAYPSTESLKELLRNEQL
jgi:ADP-ribose pyrophosphatase YjhB (NUDIX family)